MKVEEILNQHITVTGDFKGTVKLTGIRNASEEIELLLNQAISIIELGAYNATDRIVALATLNKLYESIGTPIKTNKDA